MTEDQRGRSECIEYGRKETCKKLAQVFFQRRWADGSDEVSLARVQATEANHVTRPHVL